MSEQTTPDLTGRKPDGTFAAGNRVNPIGRPKGARSKLQENFLQALHADFAESGAEAISVMRQERPADYVRCIASLMPKQVEESRPLQDMDDEQLADAIAALQRFVSAGDIAERAIDEARAEPSA